MQSTYRGVTYYNKSNKWRAKIMVNKKLIHLGYYESELDAAEAYRIMNKLIVEKKKKMPPEDHEKVLFYALNIREIMKNGVKKKIREVKNNIILNEIKNKKPNVQFRKEYNEIRELYSR